MNKNYIPKEAAAIDLLNGIKTWMRSPAGRDILKRSFIGTGTGLGLYGATSLIDPSGKHKGKRAISSILAGLLAGWKGQEAYDWGKHIFNTGRTGLKDLGKSISEIPGNIQERIIASKAVTPAELRSKDVAAADKANAAQDKALAAEAEANAKRDQAEAIINSLSAIKARNLKEQSATSDLAIRAVEQGFAPMLRGNAARQAQKYHTQLSTGDGSRG